MSETTIILLCNIPAYLAGILAVWRKFKDREFYSGIVYLVLFIVLISIAIFSSLILDPETQTVKFQLCQMFLMSLVIPILYLFHAPEGGQKRISKFSVILFAITFIFFIPALSWEVVPSYAIKNYIPPVDIMGVSIFYKGTFIYHLYWAAIILTLQSIIALRQLQKLYKQVVAHGAKYSMKSKAIYYWDFSCGFYLSLFFYLPLSFWQIPIWKMTFYIISSLIITIGNILIFLRFDLNPIADKEGNRFSLHEFMIENGDLFAQFQTLVNEQVLYERGIQAETIIQRLGTNSSYFERMIMAQYGCSFVEFLHTKRIEHAKELLSTTDKTMEIVATECGYATVKDLSRMYLHVTGKPITTLNELFD